MSMAMHFVPMTKLFFDKLCLANEDDAWEMIGEPIVQECKFGVEQFNDIVHYLITGKSCPLIRLPPNIPTSLTAHKFVPADSISNPLSYVVGGGALFPKPLYGAVYYLDAERVRAAAHAIESISVVAISARWDFDKMEGLKLNYIDRMQSIDLEWLWPEFQAHYAKAAERNDFILKYFA